MMALHTEGLFMEALIENRPLRIALLSPKGPLYRHRTGIFRKDLRAGPLTLTTLASLVPPDIAAEVKIYDEGVQDLPKDLDADLIGMTVITGSSIRAYELSAQFRARGIPVVLGGPHVTLIPDEAAQHADSIVTGYAEETWPRLLRDFLERRMRPRYDMDPEFSFSRMPHIPFPSRHLLKQRRYKTTNTFEATRGCIHHCEFCVVPHAWGTRPFQKPIAHIIDDIRQTGAKRILFYDLNLLADFSYAEALFQALIPLKVKWYGLSTVLIGKRPHLLELAARSGCRGLLIGFESVSSRVLAAYKKGFNRPEDYRELIRTLHSYGIVINGTFVFGNDADTKESFEEVQDFVLQSGIDLPRFSIMTPFPGTGLFRRLEQEQRILHRDWSKYDGQHVVFRPRNMTADELQTGHERVWREVYRFRPILNRAKVRWENFGLIVLANLAYRYYANNLERFYNCRGSLV
jgi:radical SAM superfamily enzyme YgiQ (UPF0313 family)